MDTVLFLSGTTRGATLEGIGRSYATAFREQGIHFLEISLLDQPRFFEEIQSVDFEKVKFVFSWVSMGMDLEMRRDDGTTFNPWQQLGVPFLSLHGDSPAYFFDRHVVRDTRFVSIYGFTEHAELRTRLPHVRGSVETLWPIMLDEMPQHDIDFRTKKNGTLIFLKNGKNPAHVRKIWASFLEPRLFRLIMDLASQLENNLDCPAHSQLDDLVTRYFEDHGFDMERLFRLRLFFIAQLDDYLRAVKCTWIAEVLMDFPVEIRGNNWEHLDFAGRKAKWIDECDYSQSIELIRNSLGLIDMSPNTSSRPHDRVMRAYGAHTLCLTNEQQFLEQLPHQELLSFRFEKDSLQTKINDLLAHKSPALEMGIEVAAEYRKQHPPEQMVNKMLDCAALARLDNLSQRPPGLQDFFAWPPRLL